MGIINRHKGLFIAGAASLLGIILIDAYQSEKRRADLQRRSERNKLGVDPESIDLVKHLRQNDHYRHGPKRVPDLPPDVPLPGDDGRYGSGLLREEYGMPKLVPAPYAFNSSRN